MNSTKQSINQLAKQIDKLSEKEIKSRIASGLGPYKDLLNEVEFDSVLNEISLVFTDTIGEFRILEAVHNKIFSELLVKTRLAFDKPLYELFDEENDRHIKRINDLRKILSKWFQISVEDVKKYEDSGVLKFTIDGGEFCYTGKSIDKMLDILDNK